MADAAAAGSAPSANLWRAWRYWLPPALFALTLTLVFIDPFAGDWDALDYTVLALEGRPSSMLLGRMLFIFTNHALWRIAHALFGLQPEQAYLLFKYAVVVQTPLAVVACWTLARELTASVRAATAAALLLALSPFFIIYGGQAMTEIPSLLLLSVALTIHLRGVRRRSSWLVLLGAALLGLGVNLREAAALYGPWLLVAPLAFGWKIRAREVALTALACALFFACALGPFAYWFLFDVWDYRAWWYGWLESTRMESATHPVTLGNFRTLLLWFFLASPLVLLALPLAAFKEWKERGLSPLLAMAAVGLFSNLMLITHYSTVINGRYLLTGLPGLVPLVADYLMRYETRRTGSERRALRNIVGVVLFVAIVTGTLMYRVAWTTLKSHGLVKDYRERLALLPRDAVVMAGGQTVAVTFWRGVGAGRWEVIGTGGGWPGERLVEVIEGYLREGRRVFIDADPLVWSPRGWQLEETRAVARLESRFRFRRVSETIYEIRPPDDPAARDAPNLQRLLPENRPKKQ